MIFEYPPMLTGDERDQLRQMRSYLYGMVDNLNFILAESAEDAEVSPVTEEAIPKGDRLILSEDTGWGMGHKVSEYEVHNLTAVNDFHLFYGVISANDDMSNPVIVPVFRYGNKLMGSVTTPSTEVGAVCTFMIKATIVDNDITLNVCNCRNHEAGTTVMIPDLFGHRLRRFYAIVY